MKLYESVFDYNNPNPSVVTIGTFDGVHLGHQKIIKRLTENTSTTNLTNIIISFAQHPRTVLNTDKEIKLLTTNSEKIALLDKFGVHNLVLLNFNQEIANMSGEEFVKNILVDQLHIKKIIIGYDHKFGKNRSSDIHDLVRFGKQYHFDVEQISAQEYDAITVSSTKIRNAINNGNIELANKLLGHPFSFSGKVVKGNQLGRTIGFPTANIVLDNDWKILPKDGVYLVQGEWNNTIYNGMMNIGIKPTLNENSKTIEVHFLNTEEDLYDKNITITILKFIREEQKFPSLEALKEQLASDKETANTFFASFD